MGEQRPMFRFRLPWMQSSAPAPPSPVATPTPPQNEAPSTTQPQTSTEPNVKPMTPTQRPFRLQRIAPAQPTPPTEPTVKSQSLSEPIIITSIPQNPPQAPPLWSPKISVAAETESQSQNSYQPTSPSRTRSQINSQVPSPSLSSPQFSATSQLPSPSFTTPQFSAASQLPSPQSSANSQPPSPWQIPSQEQDTSQLPSPESAPRPSSPKSAPRPSSPKSTLRPSSPKSSPQPSSTQARDASQTSLTDQAQFEKLSQVPSQLNFQSSGSAAKPPESSGPLAANATPPGIAKEMPPHKLRSDDTLLAHEEPNQRKMAVHSSGSLTRKKEKSKVAFEAEQMEMMDQDMVWGKDEATTSKHCSLDGKQTKSMKPTNNKSTVSDSRKKLKLSNGDRASFQKKIRSDISKLADKMATANPENFKDEKGSVVALVGKNKGAYMRGWLDDENNEEDQMTKSVINNNVQDINNSILMNSLITERNPGVHLALYYDATELIMSYPKKGSPEARKGKSALPLPKSLPTSLPSEGDPESERAVASGNHAISFKKS